MKKRMLSLLLVLVMAVSLFSGLSMNASADDLIADWIQNEQIIGTIVEHVFDESNVVYRGNCGDTSGGQPDYKVQFAIYEVSNPAVTEDKYLKDIFGDIGYDPDLQYYGIWIYGDGDMANYDHITNESPWSDKITLQKGTHAGETVDLEERLIVAYIEGANAENNFTTGVTSVGKDAFWGQDYLTAVFLGNSITEIKKGAFETCDLLAAINMPSALTKIGDRAFYACDKLTFLRASNTKITEIGNRAFFSCTFLADVELPYTLDTIGEYAFAWDRILGTKNLVLPNGLKTIGEGAFAFCTHFSKLNVPTSVTTIGPYAFLGAYSLSELTFTAGGTQALTIGTGAFAANYELTEVHFDDRVQSIGVSAFGACEKLARVSFGTGINRLAERAFTSMVSDAYTGLAIIAEIRAIGDPSGEIDQVLQSLTNITPLEHAAFRGDPCGVTAADDAARTFPADCLIHYPEGNRNWIAAVTKDGKWQGYQTDYYWTGHFHEFEETVTSEATCTQDGNTHRACTVNDCGYEDDVPIAALGHDYQPYSSFDPTCTEGGGTFEQCSRCGDIIQTEETEPLGHDESKCTRIEPTCTDPGRVQGTCARCGEPIDYVIPATGHRVPSATVIREATCTETGLARGRCADCGKTVEQVIPTTDHTLVTQPAVAATCTTAGKTAGSYCSVCGTVVQKQETVPAFGHDYAETERVPATAATDGYVTYTCNRCGDSYTETLPATVCSGGPSCPGYGFTDMPSPGFWSHEGLDYCLKNGIINGVGGGRVDPTGTTTRAQLVTMLYRMAGEPAGQIIGGGYVEYSKLRSPFTDTPRDQYYFNAVMWAYYNGVVDGVGE
ncbi:MAG: leucine-rich repeat domain-containing protein, partial [Oscillospiraceae bacterium]